MTTPVLQAETLDWEPTLPARATRGRWRRFRQNWLAVAGLVVIVLLGAVAVAVPSFERIGLVADPLEIDVANANLGPRAHHPLGTDQLGRDLLSRTLYGARTSLSIAVLLQLVVLVVGGLIGLVAGFLGRWVDAGLMRLTDVMYAFPDLLFVLVMAAVLGPGYWNILLSLGVVSWPYLARLVRAQVLILKEQGFIEAARAAGTRPVALVCRHVVPNVLSPVIVVLTFGVPGAIFTEAFMSFVGVGLRPPTPSWGVMVNEGYQAVFAYPHQVAVPALAISIAALAFNFVADGLRDALDPRR